MFTTDKDSFLAMPRGVLALWLAGFVLCCVVVTAVYGPDEWGHLRVVLGGTTLGAMSFYMLFINRLLVS